VDTPGISHVQETGAARAAYLHVLVPVRDERQAALARATPAIPGPGSVEAAVIETQHARDIFLIQAHPPAAAQSLEAHNWHTDARIAWLRSRSHFAVYEAKTLSYASQPVMGSTAPLRSLCLWPQGAGLNATVETTRRLDLSLQIDWSIGQVFLNDVLLPASFHTGPAASIPIPSIGVFDIRIVPDSHASP
jgi:hypothetical protein